MDAVWGDEPPAGAGNALQALVSRLRRALPEAAVESLPAGYRLLIDPSAVDVTRFERLVADGRSAWMAIFPQLGRPGALTRCSDVGPHAYDLRPV